MRAYVFVETKTGQAKRVAESLSSLTLKSVRVLTVDTVTGPYDIIAVLEGIGMEKMGRMIAEDIQKLEGVKKTMSAFAFHA
ncbi:MAG TPA: Lrp/AsnC family transcriptional regulator [Dehalococcoidia bacterium]|nr:Lrp/AsnC family transcriptional regulator [Dehalococcoidia bacterium]